MTAPKNTFKGKDVPEAIHKACKSLKVSQDQLDIEVVNTGSAGIFGLCRQKSIIKVRLKKDTAPPAATAVVPGALGKGAGKKKPPARPARAKKEKNKPPSAKKETVAAPQVSACSKTGRSVVLSRANSAGRRKGVSAPNWRATTAIPSSSVLTMTRVTSPDCRPATMLQATSG